MWTGRSIEDTVKLDFEGKRQFMRWKRLYVAQVDVVEYAEGRRGQSECMMKGLSFYCLVDMMLVS